MSERTRGRCELWDAAKYSVASSGLCDYVLVLDHRGGSGTRDVSGLSTDGGYSSVRQVLDAMGHDFEVERLSAGKMGPG